MGQTRVIVPSEQLERLAATAHYIIARTEPSKLGATKLNKILWYADLENYRRTGQSITGAKSYVRLPMGPVPVGIEDALRKLKRDKRIHERRVRVYGHERREFLWLKEPDVTQFTNVQIDAINIFIDVIKDMTADEISRITHEDDLWQELQNGDQMPIGAASIMSRTPTAEDIAWAQGIDVPETAEAA